MRWVEETVAHNTAEKGASAALTCFGLGMSVQGFGEGCCEAGL